MNDKSDQTPRQARHPMVSAHNWHSWSSPPSARVLDLSGRGGQAGGLGAEAQPVRTAAESMVSLLCDIGLDTFFGLPGGPVIPIFDAILSHPSAQLIEPRHETYGAFAAIGYHRACGKVPVVVVTAGPGATNVISGVVSAHLERVPMLVICGDVPWAATGKKMIQDTGIAGVGIEHMLKGVTRAVLRIAHPASASGQVRAAVQAATDPAHPGPSLVVISIDQAGAKGVGPSIHSPAPGQAPRPLAPETRLLHAVAGHLEEARRPLVMIGAGCRGRTAKVLRLVEGLGAPFVTTPQAKGLLPEDHPLSLRTCGMGSSLWARRYMNAGADVTLVLGTDLDDVTICATPPVGPQGVLIHVDTDAQVFARNVPTAIAALYDVGLFAEGLSAILRSRGAPRYGEALIAEARAGSPFDVAEFATDEHAPLAAHRAVADLERAAGPTASFVSDIGEHMLFALHYLTVRGEQSFAIHLGLGSMGSGISSAIGLSLGDPSRRVVCICGDGGMQMVGMELLVAIKLRLPIIYAVFNDARYNMVYHGYRLTFGKEAAWEAPLIDFAKWAEAIGARGQRIERPGEITKNLLDTLAAGGGPVVLDIRHDAELRVRGSSRTESIRDMALGHKDPTDNQGRMP